MWTDRRTDMTLIVAFPNFEYEPKNKKINSASEFQKFSHHYFFLFLYVIMSSDLTSFNDINKLLSFFIALL